MLNGALGQLEGGYMREGKISCGDNAVCGGGKRPQFEISFYFMDVNNRSLLY